MVNATLPPVIDPWIRTVSYLMDAVKILVGGLFGFYVVELFYRIFTFRRLSKQLRHVHDDLLEVRRRLDRLEKKIRIR